MLESHRPTLDAYRGFTPFLIDEILKQSPLCVSTTHSRSLHYTNTPTPAQQSFTHRSHLHSPNGGGEGGVGHLDVGEIPIPRAAVRRTPPPATEIQVPQDLTWSRSRQDIRLPSASESSGASILHPGAANKQKPQLPAWVYCTRYSDRPSAGWYIMKKAKHYWLIFILLIVNC